MKRVLLFVCIIATIQASAVAQNTVSNFFSKIPTLKAVNYIRKNDSYQFATNNWVNVTDKNRWLDLFGVENNKLWTGQQVYAIHIAGWWRINQNAIGYLYVIDLEADNGSTSQSIFISSYNTQTNTKGVDVDPFGQAPSPTGMKGKIVVTQTLKIMMPIMFVLTNKHQSPSKILSKTVKYNITENGTVKHF